MIDPEMKIKGRGYTSSIVGEFFEELTKELLGLNYENNGGTWDLTSPTGDTHIEVKAGRYRWALSVEQLNSFYLPVTGYVLWAYTWRKRHFKDQEYMHQCFGTVESLRKYLSWRVRFGIAIPAQYIPQLVASNSVKGVTIHFPPSPKWGPWIQFRHTAAEQMLSLHAKSKKFRWIGVNRWRWTEHPFSTEVFGHFVRSNLYSIENIHPFAEEIPF